MGDGKASWVIRALPLDLEDWVCRSEEGCCKAGDLQREHSVVCFDFIFLVLEMEPRTLHVPAKYFKFVLQASFKMGFEKQGTVV